MQTENKKEQQDMPLEQELSMADIEVVDSNLSLWQKIKTGQIAADRDISEKKIKLAFLSIIPNIVTVIILMISRNNVVLSDFAVNSLVAILIISVASAIIISLLAFPLRLITTPLRWGAKGLIIGTIVPLLGNLFGVVLGFGFGVIAIIIAPAAIVVPFAIKKRRGE